MERYLHLDRPARICNFNTPSKKLTLIVLLVLTIFYILDHTSLIASPPTRLPDVSTPKSLRDTRSRYAYATFLSELDDEEAYKEHDDVYLTCTRMLAYQLLHDPETRTNSSIPFVVLVSPGVPQVKRQRLTSEGAIVVEFPSINMDWMKPGRERWKHVMDKLNVFQLVQFEKVLLLDSDVVIFKRLDEVFQDPATKIKDNLGKKENIKDDEGIQPDQYLMAADTAPVGGSNHKWPAERTGILNAGFVVVHPSIAVFNHYIAVASIEGRTPGTAPENNLWEYVHRIDGNLPFSTIAPHWIMNKPNYDDWKHGIAAVHEKWFRGSLADKPLRDVLLRSRWRMDGYWSRDWK